MSAICIVPPVELPVSLAAAKSNMRVDGDHMDELITGWIQGVVSKLEHETGQRFMEQTWRVTLDAFPEPPCGTRHLVDQVKLPHPAMGVTSVKYFDPKGAEQTLAPSAYQLLITRYASVLVPARGANWPATDRDGGAVTIDMVAGYGSDSTATPYNVRLYILAKLVEQFDPLTGTERDTVQSAFIDRLLDACTSYA